MFSLSKLDQALEYVHGIFSPSPQIHWPLLSARLGAETWVKHENHLPTGAFKVRGGLVYLHELRRAEPRVPGVITATRGNHGQSIAFAARREGLRAVVAVPHGNSLEKNAAMRAFGAELVEQGHDFQAAREWAMARAAGEGLHPVPSWHPDLVRGVATGSLEFLRAVPDLDVVYVPIGMGSGICAMVAARDALGLRTRIVGVVSERAPVYALAFERGEAMTTETAETFADGIATRNTDPDALAMIRAGVDRIVQVSEVGIRSAMRHYFSEAHQVAEGAGAAPLAAAELEGERIRGLKVGLVLSGGNVDRSLYAKILSGDD